MSETGQGIVHNNQEDTLIPNSKCANAWGNYIMLSYTFLIRLTWSCIDLVQATFRWYKCMHALMGTSPVVSKAALAQCQQCGPQCTVTWWRWWQRGLWQGKKWQWQWGTPSHAPAILYTNVSVQPPSRERCGRVICPLANYPPSNFYFISFYFANHFII